MSKSLVKKNVAVWSGTIRNTATLAWLHWRSLNIINNTGFHGNSSNLNSMCTSTFYDPGNGVIHK